MGLFAAVTKQAIDNVKPAEDAVDYAPQDRMIGDPRPNDSDDNKAETYTVRSIAHGFLLNMGEY